MAYKLLRWVSKLSLRAQLLTWDSDLYKGQVSRTQEGDAVSSTAQGVH